MKYVLLILAFIADGTAQAAPALLPPGQWAITAQIITPVHDTIHYTACNKGKPLGDWMVQQPQGQICKTQPSASAHVAVTCTESLPNGMKAVTKIKGRITVSANNRSFHGKLSGGTSLPGGMQAPFAETLQGTYTGACKGTDGAQVVERDTPGPVE